MHIVAAAVIFPRSARIWLIYRVSQKVTSTDPMITLNTPSMKSCGIHFMCCTINAISAINFSWSKTVLYCAKLKFFELHRFDMYRGLFLCKIQPRKMSKL